MWEITTISGEFLCKNLPFSVSDCQNFPTYFMCRLSFLVFEKEAEYIMPFIVVSFIYLFHPFEARKSLDKPRNVKLETLMIE